MTSSAAAVLAAMKKDNYLTLFFTIYNIMEVKALVYLKIELLYIYIAVVYVCMWHSIRCINNVI